MNVPSTSLTFLMPKTQEGVKRDFETSPLSHLEGIFYYYVVRGL